MANQPTWVTSRGDNSTVITYPASAALADIMDTIETWLLAHGWSLHDALAGTNARAYKAANKLDSASASSWKYMVLDYNTASHMICKVYETWDAGAHTGTNLCLNSDGAASAQHIDLTNSGSMYIFATAQWAFFVSSTLVEGIGASTGLCGNGIFEVARDTTQDTVAAGFPCWGWMMLNYFCTLTGGATFALPRTRDGSTGVNAADTTVSHIFGAGGRMKTGTGITGGLNASTPAYVNAYNNKHWAMTMRVAKIFNNTTLPENKGRIFGMKITTFGQGTFPASDMDIKVDANFFYAPAGTLTEHWILTETAGGRMALPK